LAFVRVRHGSLYLQGRKYAECYSSEEDIASGDEPQYGDEGMIGMSDGAMTSNYSFEAISPVLGASVAVENFLLNKQDVDLVYGPINGKLHQVTVRFTTCNFKSDAKAGTLVGSFKAIGAQPKPV
jgi:hypothetical protein